MRSPAHSPRAAPKGEAAGPQARPAEPGPAASGPLWTRLALGPLGLPFPLQAKLRVGEPGDGPSPPGVSGSGAPLDRGVRSYMEPRFGADFGGVRIHAGSEAAGSARALNARAFTVGRHVVFGAGEYRPESDAGRRLLAHELTHVVQQAAARPGSSLVEPVAQRAVRDSMGSDYDIEDAIRVLRASLSFALTAQNDATIPPERKAKIRTQFNKMLPLLAKLEAARGTDGQGVAFGFDEDPKKNEINPGDSDKTIDELYLGFIAAPKPKAGAPVASTSPPAVQAWALPGGLRITPFTGGAEAQRCGLICVGIVILAGLLLSGCKSDEPSKTQSAPCVPAQTGEIEHYHASAVAWVSAAVSSLAAYRGGTDGAEHRAVVEAALNSNFKTTESKTVAAVAAKLATLQILFGSVGPGQRYTCVCSSAIDAYTNAGDTLIHLCPTWFASKDDLRRTTTLIHEMGHVSGLQGSIPLTSGKAEDIYEFHGGYATMTPQQALANPDPYAVFVRQLVHNGKEPPGSHR